MNHKISIDFLGIDVEMSDDTRNRYGVQCSCGKVDAESRTHQSADRWVTQHVEEVAAAGEQMHRW